MDKPQDKISWIKYNEWEANRKQNSCMQWRWYLIIVCAGHALKSSLRPCIPFCHLRMPWVIFAKKSKIRPGRPGLNCYYYCCLLLINYPVEPKQDFHIVIMIEFEIEVPPMFSVNLFFVNNPKYIPQQLCIYIVSVFTVL